MCRTEPPPDFFVSYTGADRAWAEWVAWELEEAGYRTLIQAWDFLPGDNFVAKMDAGAARATATVAVLSEAYFRSRFTEAEWTAAFARGKLLPVRIGGEWSEGILGPVVSIDLLGLGEEEARDRLVTGARLFLTKERGKPQTRPPFPRPAAERPVAAPGRFPGTLPPYWHVPRDRAAGFTGRREELEAIAEAFSRGERVALVGLGGIGKSQVAAEYAHAHAGEYDTVWWVRAEEPIALLEDLALLARERELVSAEASDLDEAVAKLRRFLEQEGGWLLVFDNTPAWEAIEPYVPRGSGHVLVTSRNPAWRGRATPLELPLLPPEEAAAFLQARSGDSAQDGAAAALAEELGYLPLALEQAAAYAEERSLPLQGYLERFRTRKSALLAQGRATGYPVPLAVAWELSFERVEAETPAAAVLLELLSFLAPDDIPLALLTEAQEQLPAPLPEIDAFELEDEVIPALTRTSLVKRERDALSVHRLVQLITRTRIPAERSRARCSEAVSLVAGAFSFDEADPQSWAGTARRLPHVLAVAEHADHVHPDNELGSIMDAAGRYLRVRARYDDARVLLERAVAVTVRSYGPDHPYVATCLNNLGAALRDLGDYRAAREKFLRALAIDARAYGPEHPNVARDESNLGLVLRDLGDHGAARDALERALAATELAYGPHHPDVARVASNLGLVLLDLGDFAAARTRTEQALAIDERVYGPDHPSVASDATNVGGVLRELGDAAAARPYFERALAIDERVYGRDHPEVATNASNLGGVLRDLGEHAAARAHYERALAIDEAAYGPDHPEVARDASNLGGILRELGDHPGARAHFERALAIDERAYGPDHPSVAKRANNLGSVLYDIGDHAGARAQLERALAIDERAYGPDHPRVAADASNLGILLHQLGEQAVARALLARALAIFERAFGPEHPSTQRVRSEIAALPNRDEQGEPRDARS